MRYPKDIMSEVLFSQEQIVAKAKELAERINNDYEGKPLTVVCTLKGATFFFADLMKYINIDCQIEFIKASSYIGNTTMTIGNVRISNVMNFEIENRDILIVEDIVDTGFTMKRMVEQLGTRNPESIHICTLLLKPGKLQVPLNIEYAAMEIPNDFIVGYGLDYDQQGRNLKEIYTIVE